MCTMKDWERIVREHLEAGKLPRGVCDEVVAELAAHLDETCEQARQRGMTDDAAVKTALQEIDDWRVLADEIMRAKSEEDSMNQRTKALWLPALATLTAVSLVTLALTEASLQPRFIERPAKAPVLYMTWLFSNLFFGALGAFLSRRAGGSRLARIVAGTFPAIVMFGICVVAIPVSAFSEPNPYVLHHPAGLALAVVIWAGAPGITLLAGASPFLRETRRHLSSQA